MLCTYLKEFIFCVPSFLPFLQTLRFFSSFLSSPLWCSKRKRQKQLSICNFYPPHYYVAAYFIFPIFFSSCMRIVLCVVYKQMFFFSRSSEILVYAFFPECEKRKEERELKKREPKALFYYFLSPYKHTLTNCCFARRKHRIRLRKDFFPHSIPWFTFTDFSNTFFPRKIRDIESTLCFPNSTPCFFFKKNKIKKRLWYRSFMECKSRKNAKASNFDQILTEETRKKRCISKRGHCFCSFLDF